MGNVISFFVGVLCGMVIIAVLNACSNENRIKEAYMEGYNAGSDDALHRVDRGVKGENRVN